MSKVRQTVQDDNYDQENDGQIDDQESTEVEQSIYNPCIISSRRVSSKHPPFMKVFYKHHPLLVTLDIGAEFNMIKHSVAQFIGTTIHKSNRSALQADSYPFNNYRRDVYYVIAGQ